MTPQPELQRLAALIDSEAALLRAFLVLLEREETLLIAGEADALLTLTQEKSHHYQQLQRVHNDRALLLGRLRRPNDEASIRELCGSLPGTLACWEEIRKLAYSAQHRNQINGKLIVERMQHNQFALSVLLTAAGQPQLYNAMGMTRPRSSGRHLGSA
ncbi:flagella synthesis protein FlgN [Aromatoleum buckelii]|uniref:Flagellar protein FlgN n=1 Tax=Aromatoleum buckelii TaxID=200254 RepID=A0ABX1N2E8_9RHOO|nr:flagellar protein FlgN [Aromatoleum buckelii]MCK0510884.1 flagellar protein FlgN [Aromatoleum buckelii]